MGYRILQRQRHALCTLGGILVRIETVDHCLGDGEDHVGLSIAEGHEDRIGVACNLDRRLRRQPTGAAGRLRRHR